MWLKGVHVFRRRCKTNALWWTSNLLGPLLSEFPFNLAGARKRTLPGGDGEGEGACFLSAGTQNGVEKNTCTA